MGVAERCLQYDRGRIGRVFHEFRRTAGVRSRPSIDRKPLSLRPTPFGSTPTGMRLDDLLRPYVDALEDAKRDGKPRPKPLLLLVITDGRADDPDLVKEVIVEMAGRLDDGRFPPFQLGVQFLQIGDDPDAEEFLRELDDDLKAEHGIRDIVDTVSYPGRVTSEFLLQALLGAVNKKIDAQNTEEHTEKKRRRSTMDERL
ncbi:hypothetical protein BT69DRAFT_1293455 [Atractiella rhizophila]|nr:hypothetical protein BT69DRAFT_1293455 [Atractiella rhizophila]